LIIAKLIFLDFLFELVIVVKMAELVHQRTEDMLNELEQLQRTGLFSGKEVSFQKSFLCIEKKLMN